MKFKPGQKVLVVDIESSDGLPKHYIGKVVTILTSDSGDSDWPYRIAEDENWVWREDHFVDSKEIKDPNIIFKMKGGSKL